MKNKDVNPLTALIVIVLAVCPLVLWGWAAGEKELHQASSFYLAQTPQGELSIQADHWLVQQSAYNLDSKVLDLRLIGVSEPKGNLAYFDNGDFLIKGGNGDYGLGTYATMREFSNSEVSALQKGIVQQTQNHAPLLRCNPVELSCQPFASLSAPWHHRLYVDEQKQFVHIVDGLGHQLRSFDFEGVQQNVFKSGVRYPKHLRCKAKMCSLIDTNNHRILLLYNDGKGLRLNKEVYLDGVDNGYIWLLDAIEFNGKFWVVNADSSMRSAQLQVYSLDGRFERVVDIPANAEPFNVLVKDETLFVGDISSGTIFRFDVAGNRLNDVHSVKLAEYFTELREHRNVYERYISLAQVVLVLLFLVGLWAIIKQQKAKPVEQTDSVPAYLSPSFKLYQPPNSFTLYKEVIMNNILISNIEVVPGKKIKTHIGLVQGSTVRAKHVGKDIFAGIKNIFGGELDSYTDLLSESRQEALDRMTEQAKAIGANAVINVRFSTSSITAGASEILAYGTAVLLEDK